VRVRGGLSRSACWATLALSLLLAEGVARGQDREEERTALYKQGVALADAGRWAEAVQKFQQVVAIRSAAPALFTLGQAEEHVGHLARAAADYEKALAGATAASNQDVAAASQKALDAVNPRVPRVVVRLGTNDEADAEATLDGASVALGSPARVDPGEHQIVVRGSGGRAFERKVSLAEGQSVEVLVAFEREAPVAPPVSTAPPAPEAPSSGSSFPVGPAALAAVGLAAGIAGFLVRTDGETTYNNANASCTNGQCGAQSTVDSGNAGRSRMILGTAVLSGGIAAFAGAGVWWLLGSSSSSSGAKVGVALSPVQGGARASIAARF